MSYPSKKSLAKRLPAKCPPPKRPLSKRLCTWNHSQKLIIYYCISMFQVESAAVAIRFT